MRKNIFQALHAKIDNLMLLVPLGICLWGQIFNLEFPRLNPFKGVKHRSLKIPKFKTKDATPIPTQIP